MAERHDARVVWQTDAFSYAGLLHAGPVSRETRIVRANESQNWKSAIQGNWHTLWRSAYELASA
jgi:hypothetical protein